MLRAIALALLAAVPVVSSGCQTREATAPTTLAALPQDPQLVGAWEAVNVPIQVPRDDVAMAVVQMNVEVRPSGEADAPTPYSFEVRTVQAFSVAGERRETDSTSWCDIASGGLISCSPSHEGAQTGYSGLGWYEIDGSTLTLRDPDSDVVIRLQRTAGGE